MFHPQKIAAKIQAIEQAKGIRLRENSVSDCIRLYDHFKSMEVMAGKKVVYARNGETPATFQLTSQEKQWIENEMYMCACSFPYWFFRYFFIKTKEGDITRPQVLIAQMVLLAILAVLDLANLPILLLILKARQLGLSTIIEGVILYIAIFVKGSHCVVASAEEEKSEQMSNMVWIGLEMLPLWMQPVLTREDRKIGPEFGLIHSDILLQHGSMSKGISRGDTPNAAHLCLRGDALIFSQDGNLVPIEKINIGEKVWTHTGNMSTVKAISKIPSRKRKMLQINTWMNCEPLHLTADHKIWTARGWVRAINLIRGKDEIGTAIRPITGEITQLTTHESRDVLGRLKTVTSRSQVITLDKEFGFFCGYYLAEGSAKRQTKDSGGRTCEITLTHHIDESRYAQRAKEAIDKYVTSHKTHGREGTKTGVTHIYGTSFASLIFKEFGAKDSKRIPDWIFKTNPEFIKGVIIGYLTGDGSKTIQKNNPALFATSVRPRLLYQFRHLLASVGWGWGGITKEKAFRDNRGWNNSESWTLTIAGAAAQRLRKEIGIKCVEDYQERTYTNKYRIDGGWVWCKVKDFHLSFATHVWDIEVDHIDHSFETVIGAVANSEVAYYPDPINTIESSLIRAMHENPRTFLALETTARKKDDWFHRTWLKNRKGELTGYNRFTCLFLPWYVGRDKYPTADWLRNHPIPQHWRVVSDGRNEPWRLIQGRIETGPLKETFKQAADAKLYVATTKMLKDHMPENWEMPPEQMWYWEFNYVEAIEGDDETLKSFLAELAADERSCIAGNQRVSTNLGLIPISQAARARKTETGSIIGFQDNGIRECVEITTEYLRSIICTPDHLIKVGDRWIEAQNLKPGDELVISRPEFAVNHAVAKWKWSPGCEMSVDIDEDFAKLAGWYLGDGWWRFGGIGIAIAAIDPELVAECSRLMEKFIGTPPVVSKVGKMFKVMSDNVRWKEVFFNLGLLKRRVIKENGSHRSSGYTKNLTVPEFIWRSPRSVVAAFLSGLFESDGYASPKWAYTKFFSKDLAFMRDIQFLLLGFGINAKFRHVTRKLNGKIFPGCDLVLNGKSTDLFHSEIGFISNRKKSGAKTKPFLKAGRGMGRPSLPIATVDKVASVITVGERHVYDLSISRSHQFGVNGLMVHNCFQSKKLSVFTQAELDRLEENISADYQCYAMAGDGIDKRFALADFHSHSKRRIDINWQTINGDFLHWKLIPLKEEPQDINLKYYLKIWDHPKPGYDYTIGIDIASGIGQNNTVYFILKKGLAGAPDEEVALLYSPWIPSPETPPFANMLGVYYGQHMSPVPEALMAPEVQKAVGDFISHQLAKLGYSNFYYMERFDIRKSPGHRPNRRGWASVGWSQQMMKEAFEHGIKAGWIQVNSEELLAELDSLEAEETDSGKMMYDHASDHTDDAYVAGGIAYFVTHGQETIMERQKSNLKPSRKSKKEIAVQEPDKGATLLARQFQREDRAEFPNAAEEGEGDPLKRVY